MSHQEDKTIADPRAITVSVGHPSLQHGRTVLEFSLSGEGIIRNLEGTDERTWEVSVPTDKLTSLIKKASRLGTRRSARPGIPDEARYRFEVHGQLGESVVAELWESDLEGDRALRDLLYDLRSIVSRGSVGEALL